MLGRPTALVVEDEALIARDLVLCLEELGFEVTASVDSCNDAMRSASERKPDVVLMDIHIKGGIDGIATATMLRERYAVPVIYVTAWSDRKTIGRAAESEPYGYIVKPFTKADVRSAVEIARHRHESDRRSAERERWFTTTLRSIGDAVIACDEQEHVRFLNRAAEQLLGVTEREAAGSAIDEIVRVAADAVDVGPVGRALRERKVQTSERSASLLGRDGEPVRTIEQAAAPILHGDELLGAVLILRDVTEQRRMQEQLAATDRLTSLGSMAASVGHEINNPLAYNLSNVDFALGRLRELQEANPALGEVVTALEEARAGGKRIAEIVGDLRTFSRSQEGLHHEIDVRPCVEWALRLTANQVRHAARLVTELERVPRVLGNEVRLSQVLVDLLLHASTGVIGPADQNEIRVRTGVDARGHVLVEVEDTGPGTTTAAGLQLAISREVVEWMGGTLEVDAEPGRGTCFRVMLPPGARPRERTRDTATGTPANRSLRVLVIEDDQLLARALGRMLAQQHRVVVTSGGEEGLAVLEKDPAFDLVLCDMMMPHTSGMEVYETLLARSPELAGRIIFMTGGAFTPRAAEFLATVGNPTLGKPFSRDDLLATLQGRHAQLEAAAAAGIDPS
jgi:PAS domain S-box-containing protein